MSANEHLNDLANQHALALLGYSNSVQKEMFGFLNDLEADVVEKLAARLAVTQTKGFDPGPKSTAKLNDTIDEIRTLTTGVYDKSHDYLKGEFTKFAQVEAEGANKAINSAAKASVATKLPSPERLKAIVTQRPIHGEMLQPLVKRLGTETANRVEQQIRLGMANGEGIDKIVARVTGTEGFDRSRNAARAMVRTSVNSISNQAQQETWKANSHIIKGWQFLATLDSRTTVICGSLDGQVFPLGEGPIPPRHIQCRSVTVAVTKDLKLETKKYNATTRASMDGQVAATTNFDQYLKGKDEAFQNATLLGKTRGDLWRSGKLDLSDFVRNYNEVIPLDQLRALHPEAFGGEVVADTVAETVSKASTAAGPFKPINDAVTAQSLAVRPRKTVVKAITDKLAMNAKDSRYDPLHEFKGIKETDFGKAVLSSGFTDEAATMIEALVPELDAVTDAFGVPRIRAIRSTAGKNIGSMGDGTLNLNPTFFTGYATEVGGGSSTSDVAAALIAKREAIALELTQLRADIDAAKVKMATLTGAEKDAAILEYMDKADTFNAKRKDYLSIDKKVLNARKTDRAANKASSTWKPGDDVKLRPFNAVDYFDAPMDRARNVFFHEIAHHVHQYTNKTVRRRVATPPLEIELRRMFQAKFYKLGEGHEKKKLVSTTYATSNEFEWFAESFGLYMMGRYDLVDAALMELIEQLLKRAKA